jgi:hypothetical protein
MKKSIGLFLLVFMVQMEAGDREITHTVRAAKSKGPLPEKVPLLVNGISSPLAEKKELKSRRSEDNLKASLTYNVINLPKEIIVLIFEKMLPFDDTRKDDQKYCNARNAIKDIVENKPCSLGLLFKAFYAVEARKHIPLDFGVVNTNLDIIDILDLDDNSAAKLQNLLHGKLDPCCWGYSKYPSCLMFREYEYPKLSSTELKDLNMIADLQGWNVKDDAKTNNDVNDCSCGKCVMCCAALPGCAGAISMLFSWWAEDPACCSGGIAVKTAKITGFSLFGVAGGCLISGAICWACHSCGEDCKLRRGLYSITKTKK